MRHTNPHDLGIKPDPGGRPSNRVSFFDPHTRSHFYETPSSLLTDNMRFSIAVLALVAAVSAQSLADLPVCAQTCVKTSEPKCGVAAEYVALDVVVPLYSLLTQNFLDSDVPALTNCVCTNVDVLAEITTCVLGACSEAEQATVIAGQTAICGALVTGSQTGGASETGAPTGSNSAGVPTGSGGAPTGSGATVPTGTGTRSTPSPSATTPPDAASRVGAGLGAILAAGLAMAL